MDPCRWSEGHLALFEALREICDRVGDDNARGRLTTPPCASYYYQYQCQYVQYEYVEITANSNPPPQRPRTVDKEAHWRDVYSRDPRAPTKG